MKKKIAAALLVIGVVLSIFVVRKFIFLPPQENPSGVLLAFDDYYPENWEEHFDLFDKYDADVTFFINAAEPTEFCTKAVEKGHEIGFHTKGHTDLRDLTEEEIYEEAIDPIEDFREEGIELTTFAYPYGNYTYTINEQLLQYYKVVRGGWHYELYSKEDAKQGLVEARCMDNANFDSDLRFKLTVNKMLYEARWKEGTVVALYSHGIESGEWCITPERLEYILKRADQLGMEFYTFKDLQQEQVQ